MASAYCTLGWKRRQRPLGRDNQRWKRNCWIDWRSFLRRCPLAGCTRGDRLACGAFYSGCRGIGSLSM